MRNIISQGISHQKLGILFVCSANVIRSPTMQLISEEFIEQNGLGGTIRVSSAGLYEWDTCEMRQNFTTNLRVLQDVQERGIKKEIVARFKPNPDGLSPDNVNQADIILVAEEFHRKALIERFPEASQKAFLIKEALPLMHNQYGEDVPDGLEHFDEMDEALRGNLLPLFVAAQTFVPSQPPTASSAAPAMLPEYSGWFLEKGLVVPLWKAPKREEQKRRPLFRYRQRAREMVAMHTYVLNFNTRTWDLPTRLQRFLLWTLGVITNWAYDFFLIPTYISLKAWKWIDPDLRKQSLNIDVLLMLLQAASKQYASRIALLYYKRHRRGLWVATQVHRIFNIAMFILTYLTRRNFAPAMADAGSGETEGSKEPTRLLSERPQKQKNIVIWPVPFLRKYLAAMAMLEPYKGIPLSNIIFMIHDAFYAKRYLDFTYNRLVNDNALLTEKTGYFVFAGNWCSLELPLFSGYPISRIEETGSFAINDASTTEIPNRFEDKNMLIIKLSHGEIVAVKPDKLRVSCGSYAGTSFNFTKENQIVGAWFTDTSRLTKDMHLPVITFENCRDFAMTFACKYIFGDVSDEQLLDAEYIKTCRLAQIAAQHSGEFVGRFDLHDFLGARIDLKEWADEGGCIMRKFQGRFTVRYVQAESTGYIGPEIPLYSQGPVIYVTPDAQRDTGSGMR